MITHFHLDHWGDLVPWTFGAMYGPGRELPKPELWLPPGGLAELEQFGKKFGVPGMFSEGFDAREYGDGEPFDVVRPHGHALPRAPLPAADVLAARQRRSIDARVLGGLGSEPAAGGGRA